MSKWTPEALARFRAQRREKALSVTLEQAFWKSVSKKDSCWEWTAGLGNHGYGQITYLQQKYTSHRVSWELHFGLIPDDLCVLHKCDNRKCVKPEHLFLGTRKENLEDMTKKGRRAQGKSLSMSIKAGWERRKSLQ